MLIDLAYIAKLYQQNPNIMPEMVWSEFCRRFCEEAVERKYEYDHLALAKTFANLSCKESMNDDLESKEMVEMKKEGRAPNISFIREINIYFETNSLNEKGKFAELVRTYLRCYPEYQEKFNLNISVNGLLLPLSEKELDEFVLSITLLPAEENHPIIDIDLYCEMLGTPFAMRIYNYIRERFQLSILNRISFSSYRGIDILCQIQPYLPEEQRESICDHLLSYLAPAGSLQKGIYNALSYLPILGYGISYLANDEKDGIYNHISKMRNLLSEAYKNKVINKLKPLVTAESYALNSALLNLGFDEEPAVYDMIISHLSTAQESDSLDLLALLRKIDKSAFSSRLTQAFMANPSAMRSTIFSHLALLDEFISENDAHDFFTLLYNIAMQPSWFYTTEAFVLNQYQGCSLSPVKHRYSEEQLDNYTLKTAKYLLENQINNELLLSQLQHLTPALSHDIRYYISQALIDQITRCFNFSAGSVLAKMPGIASPLQKFNMLKSLATTLADADDLALSEPSNAEELQKKMLQIITILPFILNLIPHDRVDGMFRFYCAVATNTEYSIALRSGACLIVSKLAAMYNMKIPQSLLQTFTEQMKDLQADNRKFAFKRLLAWNRFLTDLIIREDLFTTLLDNFFQSQNPQDQFYMLVEHMDDMIVSRQGYKEIFEVLKKFPVSIRDNSILLLINKLKANIQGPDKTNTLNYLTEVLLKENRDFSSLGTPGIAATQQINVCMLHQKNVCSFGLFATKLHQAVSPKPGKSLLQKGRDLKDSRAHPYSDQYRDYAQRQEAERFNNLYPFRLFNIIAAATKHRHVQIEFNKKSLPADIQDIIFDYGV